MPSLSDGGCWGRCVATSLLATLLLVLLATPAEAAELSASDLVLVDTGTVVSGDLYAAGNRVLVLGTIEGDLLVTSFNDVVVAGTVTGDVVGMAGSFAITGRVGGSVRVVAADVVAAGDIAGDLVAVAWTTTVGERVGGDVLLWGRQGVVAAEIGGDLRGQSRRLTLGGRVEGDVDVTTRRLGVDEDTVVGGDLGYRSPDRSDEVDRAEVAGAVVHRTPLPPNIRLRALLVLAKVVLSLLAGVVGLLIMWAFPAATARAGAAIRESWWSAWLRGILVAVTPLVLLGLAALLLAWFPPEAALPVVGVMLPVVLAAFGVVTALALAAPAAVYPWLGNRLPGAKTQVRAFLMAMVLVTVATQIPWVTLAVLGAVLPIGIGAWVGRGQVPDSSAPGRRARTTMESSPSATE